MEKLLINNFAGLKEVTIEVRPISGFIGPQASGKSVIAKLLYFFREIAYRLPVAMGEDMNESQYQSECRERFTRYFPFENTGTSNFEIIYWSGHEKIRVLHLIEQDTGRESFKLEWSQFFTTAIERFVQRKQPLLDRRGRVNDKAVNTLLALREEYDHEASRALGQWSKYEQIFIPAGRAFFSQLRATVFTSLEAGEAFDPFVVAFGSLLERSKQGLKPTVFFGPSELPYPGDDRINQFIRSTFKSILSAEIDWSDKQELLRFDDGRLVKLAQASSGQQEVLPLLFLLAHFLSTGNARGRAVYIEEPEAHVFPSTQKRIVEFMARVFRARQRKMRLVLTTHSPYILTSINNLLEAGRLYSGASGSAKKRLENVVPVSQILKPGEVAFYSLENGNAKSIIDSETGLIDAAAIDGVSDEIATQFDKLLLEGNEKL